MAMAAYQAPAEPQGPRVLDIEKLKDNLYVLTSLHAPSPSASPAERAAFSGGKYQGYTNERVKGAIQAVFDELKK